MKRIPVTIITGFLGSGKTTLLNSILKKYSDKKIVVIENEIGATNIDSKLLQNVSKGQVFEMTNGCICCSIQSELGVALNSIILSKTDCDQLIIETTGIADPGDIIKTFFAGERVMKYFELDSVICVLDALQFSSQLEEFPEVDKQLNFSDIVLINKVDLVSPDIVREIRKNAENRMIKNIFELTFSDISNVDILGRFSFSTEKIVQEVINYQTANLNLVGKNKHSISSELFSYDRSFKSSLLYFWLEQFMHLNKNKVYRIKGIVRVIDSEKRIIIHAVKDVINFFESEDLETSNNISKLVFIGKKVERVEIDEALRSLLV